MRKAMVGMLMLGGALLVAGGCAKNDVVKPDQPVTATAPPATTPPATATTKPAPAATATVKEEPASPLPVQGDTVSMREPSQAAVEVKSALEKVYFDFDSYALNEPARDTLYKNAEQIIKKSAAKYAVEGHCDERGSDEYNLALGEKRAKSAYNYLITLGVAPDRLATVSYGKERPAEQGHDEAAWGKNRRVEFSITK